MERQKAEAQLTSNLDKTIHLLDGVGVFSGWVNVISIILVFAMVGLTFVDVIFRYLLNAPIRSAFEITGVMLIVATFTAIAHTHNQKAHITVDVITSKMSKKVLIVLSFITDFLGILLLVIIVWRSIMQAHFFFQRGSFHSDSLQLHAWPFECVIVFGSILMGLLVLRDLLKDISDAIKARFAWNQWLLMVGICVLILALCALWVQRDLWNISLAVVGFIGLIVFMILLLAGVPVAFTLLIAGVLFIAHIRGPNTAFNYLGRGLYSDTGQFIWATVPFFVLMGYFCLHSRIGEDLYVLFNRWIGHFPGGLAIATTTACTGFAAIVGDSISSIATMTSVSMPQMKKFNYDDALSTGAIAGGSIIGPVIPPSVPFIVYGVITGVSVGQLFVAGIVPGLLLGLAFAIMIYIWCRISPHVGPAGKRSPWRLRIRSLSASAPILILFFLVIGGIYGGVFSPSEGGAIGAVGALIIGLIMRRFTWRKIWQAAADTTKVLSMLLLIVCGATLFTRFVAWCNVTEAVSDALTGIGLKGMYIVLFILIIFLMLGCFVDILTLTLIGVPIVHPIAVAQGANPIWFSISILLVLIVGSLTPPVGINLFTMKGMAPHIPMGAIYRGSIPFIIASLVVIAIIFIFPGLVTWLPNLLR